MTTIYLIRHSIKDKNLGIIDNNDTEQVRNEKTFLSCEGEEKALLLSKNQELQNIDEIWASNYVRASQTAKYICKKNNLSLNISSAFDQRHYGIFNKEINREEFWIGQFIDEKLKNPNGESNLDVRNRMDHKINEIMAANVDKKIAIVCHNTCILFYLLKYCKLEKAEINKKITISYKNKILIKGDIMKSPSIMKLEFENKKLVDISYIEI